MAEYRARAGDCPPDPRATATASEFVAGLRLLRVWAGNPSFERLARSSGVPRSTLGDALSGRRDRLPAFDVVRRFVRACGVVGDDALVWEGRWRELQAGAVAATGSVEVAPVDGRKHPVPRQLPADVTGFVGRGDVISALDRTLTDGGEAAPVVISAVSGTAGVGKTALAVHWAHRIADHFPDGQLYVNLRGYHPDPPMRSIEALGLFLRALGTTAERIPEDLDEAAGLFRTLLADRRVLVVLDNARDADQVRPLLPGGAGCLVLITSRNALTGLVARDGAHGLSLDVLAPAESHALLDRLLGEDQARACPAAIAELAELCAHLPLAMRIAAAHIAGDPQTTVAGYLEQLRGSDPLAALAADGDKQTAVRATFDLSYGALPAPARRMFRRLGLAPGPDFTPVATAALAGTTVDAATALLGRLESAHLISRSAPGRYAFHDLLRRYAQDRAVQEDAESDRAAATERLLRHYLGAADAAARLLYPQMLRLPETAPRPGRSTFIDHAEASAWLDAERPNLVAAIAGAREPRLREAVWILADTLRGYFYLRMYVGEWLTVADAALAAAEAESDPYGQAAARFSLATRDLAQGRNESAVHRFRELVPLAQRIGWLELKAAVLGNLGMAYRQSGLLDRAASCYRRALAFNRGVGRLGGQATNLASLAAIYYERGQLRLARQANRDALAIFRGLEARSGEAGALADLGELQHLLGHCEEARQLLEQAVELHRETGNRTNEAEALRCLAAVRRDCGQHDEALALSERALAITRETGERRYHAMALNTHASVLLLVGQEGNAIDHHQRAIALSRETGHRYPEADADIGLAVVRRRLRQYERALGHADHGRELARSAGFRLLEGQALTELAAIYLDRGDVDRAIELARQALVLRQQTGHRLGQAHTHRVLGDALHAAGQVEPGHHQWRAAYRLYLDVGSPRSAEVMAILQT